MDWNWNQWMVYFFNGNMLALAMLAEMLVSDTNPMKNYISPLIMILAFVIGLTEIGIASIIITSGFIIILGALAATFIISVGIGSIPDKPPV